MMWLLVGLLQWSVRHGTLPMQHINRDMQIGAAEDTEVEDRAFCKLGHC